MKRFAPFAGLAALALVFSAIVYASVNTDRASRATHEEVFAVQKDYSVKPAVYPAVKTEKSGACPMTAAAGSTDCGSKSACGSKDATAKAEKASYTTAEASLVKLEGDACAKAVSSVAKAGCDSVKAGCGSEKACAETKATKTAMAALTDGACAEAKATTALLEVADAIACSGTKTKQAKADCGPSDCPQPCCPATAGANSDGWVQIDAAADQPAVAALTQ